MPGTYSCSDACSNDCLDPDGSDDACVPPTCAETSCGYWLDNGYTCDYLSSLNYDCSTCEAEGECASEQSACEAAGGTDSYSGDGKMESAIKYAKQEVKNEIGDMLEEILAMDEKEILAEIKYDSSGNKLPPLSYE